MLSRAARWLVLVTLAVPPSDSVLAEEKVKEQPLPLKRVVLFSSSVGFFEHAGIVEGNKQIDFTFKTTDINDLLKSMVVQDRGGGLIKAVNYGSPEPLTRTLRTLAIDLADSPTLAEIFQQLRGQQVELQTPQPITGVIVGVEVRQVPRGADQIAQVEVLNLRTSDGLRSVQIENIERTKFTSEKIEREFQQALELLAGQRTIDMRTVKLDFQGAGQRPVAVGYIQEAPVWKTSYRLVLADDQPPFLQGWAIVENTSTQDWKEVALTLISGRPISFVMELDQPLFMSRPRVALQGHASLAPRVYDQDLADGEAEFRRAGGAIAGRKRGKYQSMDLAGGGGLGGLGGGGGFGAGGGFGGGLGGVAVSDDEVDPFGDRSMPIDPRSGVESIAAGQDVGELFRYVIKTPVTLPRNESAMLPIVNDEVQGEKVAIYNPAAHARHPLCGLKLTNSTQLHLLQGPITVFDGSEYAGDAQIEDIPPGSTRLISYALDLETEIVPETRPEEQVLVALSIRQGGLHIKHKGTRKTHYTIKNSGDEAKQVLIERPIDAAWTIVSPAQAEKTRSLYRFATKAEPGKTQTLVITEQRDLAESLVLSGIATSQLELYMSAKVISPPLRQALEETIRRKTELAKVAEQRAAAEKQIAALAADQERARQNLRAVNNVTDLGGKTKGSELTERYLTMVGQIEDKIAQERTRLTELARAEEKAKLEFEKYVAELVVE